MLDKSYVHNVLAEGTYFLDENSPSNLYFLDFPGFSSCINFAPLCNILAKI